jgi:hypothetical protein
MIRLLAAPTKYTPESELGRSGLKLILPIFRSYLTGHFAQVACANIALNMKEAPPEVIIPTRPRLVGAT